MTLCLLHDSFTWFHNFLGVPNTKFRREGSRVLSRHARHNRPLPIFVLLSPVPSRQQIPYPLQSTYLPVLPAWCSECTCRARLARPGRHPCCCLLLCCCTTSGVVRSQNSFAFFAVCLLLAAPAVVAAGQGYGTDRSLSLERHRHKAKRYSTTHQPSKYGARSKKISILRRRVIGVKTVTIICRESGFFACRARVDSSSRDHADIGTPALLFRSRPSGVNYHGVYFLPERDGGGVLLRGRGGGCGGRAIRCGGDVERGVRSSLPGGEWDVKRQ